MSSKTLNTRVDGTANWWPVPGVGAHLAAITVIRQRTVVGGGAEPVVTDHGGCHPTGALGDPLDGTEQLWRVGWVALATLGAAAGVVEAGAEDVRRAVPDAAGDRG